MASSGFSGTVHPQLACALSIVKGLLPEFLNWKRCSTISPSFTLPKSNALSMIVTFVESLIGSIAIASCFFSGFLISQLYNKKLTVTIKRSNLYMLNLLFIVYCFCNSFYESCFVQKVLYGYCRVIHLQTVRFEPYYMLWPNQCIR